MDLPSLRRIPFSYDGADSDASARRLIFALFPDWEHSAGELELHNFTEGITNTLLKATKIRPGAPQSELDADAVLIRAYGQNTELLIDREREIGSHQLLSTVDLAPELLARFDNGMMYRFIPGTPCTAQDLRTERVYRGVARRLGEWHAVLSSPSKTIARLPAARPALGRRTRSPAHGVYGNVNSNGACKGMAGGGRQVNGDSDVDLAAPGQEAGKGQDDGMRDGDSHGHGCHPGFKKKGVGTDAVPAASPGPTVSGGSVKAEPNVWTVLAQWLSVLPSAGAHAAARNAELRAEFGAIVAEFADLDGLGEAGLVLGHCDLLGGNLIQLAGDGAGPSAVAPTACADVARIAMIDYEYATPCPAALDIAMHFAEWAGFECEYERMPTRSERRRFLEEYLASFKWHSSVAIAADAAGGGARAAVADGDGAASLPGRVSTRTWPAEHERLGRLFALVDAYRGLPGFWWGVWALVQASISDIDFDYAWYAETRLAEYWDWKAAREGEGGRAGGGAGTRERRWAME